MASRRSRRRGPVRRAGVPAGVTRYWSLASPINAPIVATPVLDANSAAIAGILDGAALGVSNVAYGTSICWATPSTPRWSTADTTGGNGVFRSTNAPSWGANPLAGLTIPLDPAWEPPPGYPPELPADHHMAIIDTDGRVFSLWRYVPAVGGTGPSCSFSGWQYASAADTVIADQVGDAVGSGFNRLAGLIRREELEAGVIEHAMVFATRYARPTTVLFPAKKTDGSYLASPGNATVSNSIPESQRVQLDPTIDLDAVPSITTFEKIVGKCLQTYGAYCVDNSGAASPIQLMFEIPPSPSLYSQVGNYTYSISDPVYTALGVTSETPVMSHIPLAGNLRVLKNWDGAA